MSGPEKQNLNNNFPGKQNKRTSAAQRTAQLQNEDSSPNKHKKTFTNILLHKKRVIKRAQIKNP